MHKMQKDDLLKLHPSNRAKELTFIMKASGFSSSEITKSIGVLSVVFSYQYFKKETLPMQELARVFHLTTNAPLWRVLNKLEAIDFIERVPLVGKAKAVILTEKVLLRNYVKTGSESDHNNSKYTRQENIENGMRCWRKRYLHALEEYLVFSRQWDKKEWLAALTIRHFARKTKMPGDVLGFSGKEVAGIINRSEPVATGLVVELEKKGLVKRIIPEVRKGGGAKKNVILTDYPLRWKEAFDKGELAAFDAAEAEKRQ